MIYQSTRFENETSLQIKLPWDKNTARGFIISLIITVICVLLAPVFKIAPITPNEMQYNSVPITLLSFGEGDGTGVSKGNLAKEGAKYKGNAPKNELEDASKASNTKFDSKANPKNPDDLANYVPQSQLSSNEKNNNANQGSGARNLGYSDGSSSGTGLGEKGEGPGKGMGFGDIEWGGGGNRTVLYKKIPSFPPGVNTSAQIKIQFTVLPDGTVGKMIPLQKADPRLEKAAMDALRQWRFNPLKQNIEMVGIIPLTFRLR